MVVTVRLAIGRKQREVKLIDMEMQDVEVLGILADPVEHEHVIGIGSRTLASRRNAIGVQPTRPRGRDQIAAGEQGHVVTQADQLVVR